MIGGMTMLLPVAVIMALSSTEMLMTEMLVTAPLYLLPMAPLSGPRPC